MVAVLIFGIFCPLALGGEAIRAPSGSNPGVEAAKKPVTARVTGFLGAVVPPTGFEPVISTLKGWRPWPLDDGDSGKEYSRLFRQYVYR